jgi:zinc protease
VQSAFARCVRYCLAGALGVGLAVVGGDAAHAEPRVSTFKLPNGMDVIVVPDHRVPVVTHMVWYRAGAGEDPWGTSGIAHFLEHLMFKSTSKLKSGEFSRTITRLGGRDNAQTTHDTTAYFQRVAKENLRTVMALEADRMVGLKLIEEEVRTERDVILEERRSSVDVIPLSILNEQMLAALYQNHPYGRPALGWAPEMAKLTRADAGTFYRRYYAPNNAVLVVAGDVTVEEVRPLALATYGRNKAVPALQARSRPQEPPSVAERRVQLQDARAGANVLLRYYHAPSYASAKAGDPERVELLAYIVGGDDTSRMYARLVTGGIASTAGTDYTANTLDSGRLSFVIIPVDGVTLAKAESELDAILAEVRETGVTQEELERAKLVLEARRVFESDNQMTLARRYGEGVALGRSVADLDAQPARIQAVTVEDVQRVAREHLKKQSSVTGTVTPPPANTTAPKSSAEVAKP